jgi:hypothetical protein
MASRWDRILELEKKPVPIVEHLLEEVAGILAKDLQQWPPPIEELDLDTGGRFRELLSPGSKRPDDAVYEEAFRVARWELQRDLDASAEYFRNQRWIERGLSPAERPAILFLSAFMVEQLLSLREYTHSRISRPRLVDCLDQMERRFAALSGPLRP